MVMWVAILALVAGCGRTGFEALDRGDADGSDATTTLSDAAPRVLTQRSYVKASNTAALDFFGFSVALSADGSTLAVGAAGEDSAATAVGGNQADNSATGSGAVYVFTRAGSSWALQAYLKASNTGASDQFGISVALSANGSTLAVGATGEASAATGIDGNQASNSITNAGAVYVFTRSGALWTQQAYVKASNPGSFDEFGFRVAVSADGSTLAVAADRESSAATGIGGNQADDTATYAGAVYVFTRAGTSWTQQAYVKASNTRSSHFFGTSVALSADGSTLVVGAWGDRSGAIGIGGDQADATAASSGAAYVFTRAGATWTQDEYIKASNTGQSDQFGRSIALSGDGSTIAVGAYGESSVATGINADQADDSARDAGAVYVFTRTATSWVHEAYIKASNTGAGDWFGESVTLSADGSTLAVGAIREDSAANAIGGNQVDDTMASAGAVYMFSRAGTTWSQAAYVKASNAGANHEFGFSVTLSADGSMLGVGAYNEPSAATAVDGNQADTTAPQAGAVYGFQQD